jgi:magnesium transporter
MIFTYNLIEGVVHKYQYTGDDSLLKTAVWIDCVHITPQENDLLEAIFTIELPTREEMQAIEMSSRIYKENGILYMTADIISQSTSLLPVNDAVTFMVCPEKLVTLRYSEPYSFVVFSERLLKSPNSHEPEKIFFNLMETVIYRCADIPLTNEERLKDVLRFAT